jgi:hypothetical protein
MGLKFFSKRNTLLYLLQNPFDEAFGPPANPAENTETGH